MFIAHETLSYLKINILNNDNDDEGEGKKWEKARQNKTNARMV